MKKFYLLSVLLFGFIYVYSQTQITLTFHAKDSLTQNPLALDSVNIKNLIENCDTTLYDSVSVLNLEATWPVGIDEPTSRSSGSFVVMQNVPNPFQGSTLVRIWLKNAGELNLAVYDNQGKNLSQYHNRFEKGWHSFGITTNGTRLLFLMVSDNTTTKTIKLLSTGSGNDGDRISYEGLSDNSLKTLKSVQDSAGFIFYLGNQLQYTAYVDGYRERTLSDNPVLSKSYTFAMRPSFVCGDNVSYSGQNYHTLLIGDQCWFKENLNVGTMINGSQNQTNDSVIEKYCYNNQTSNCDVYGGLYQWGEMVQYLNGASNSTSWNPVPTGNVQGICPTGWHLPSISDWTTLINYLGGTNVAGGKMKEAGTTHWDPPNTGATNSSGFTALGAGMRGNASSFTLFHVQNILSAATEYAPNGGNAVWLDYSSAAGETGGFSKYWGFSVRCVKD